jgi:hypothetical protein
MSCLKVEHNRQLIDFMLTNLQHNGKKLMFTIKKPFDLFLKIHESYELLTREDSNLRPQSTRNPL